MPPGTLLHWQRTDSLKTGRSEIVGLILRALGRQGTYWKAGVFWKARRDMSWLTRHFDSPVGEVLGPWLVGGTSHGLTGLCEEGAGSQTQGIVVEGGHLD